jgi:deoxyribonuclease V
LRQVRATPQWPETAETLIGEQLALAAARPAPWVPEGAPIVAGCFVCFPRGETARGRRGDPGWAAAAALRERTTVATAVVTGEAGAPYQAGLLALREGPLLEAAVRALPVRPDVVLVDATARDHPRGAGLALHLGARLEIPTIGITHRSLTGGGADAFWLRTRTGARPLLVHPAWRTDAEAAREIVRAACGRARTPEPLREARRLARVARARAGG